MGKDLKGNELGKGISQRKDGLYMGRAQVKGVPIVQYDRNLKEVRKKLAQAVAEQQQKIILPQLALDGNAITLSEWFEEWYEQYKAPTLQDGGSASYKRKFLNYYGVRIGSKPVSEIRQLHVQTAVADMIKAKISVKSIGEATGILRGCFEAAMANGLTKVNPVVGVVLPKTGTVERRVLTVEEQDIFLKYLKDTKSWYEEMYKFMLLTGMRIGEVSGLQWEDVDFVNKFIYVKRALKFHYENGKKTLKLGTTKTQNSVRKIPFFGETQKVLESQFEKIKQRRMELGDRWRQPEELGNLVFLTSMGSPVGRYNAGSDLRYVTQQINETFRVEAQYTGAMPRRIERLHPHALRHTFATRCFEKGMSPRTVQEIMGHANYNTTVSYTHVMDDIKLKEAERVGNFLQNTSNSTKIEYESLIGIM